MPWNYWVIGISSQAEPPDEWVGILGQLSGYIEDKYINKVEVAAFTIRGVRTARWLIANTESEYSNLQNALGSAKKLTWLLLLSQEGPGLDHELKKSLKCTKTAMCVLLEGHGGNCSSSWQDPGVTRCPLCLEPIKLSDFNLDGRKDALSIQMGHSIPLSRINQGHKADNVYWQHRRCNYIQDEQTLASTVENLVTIVERHGFVVSRPGSEERT